MEGSETAAASEQTSAGRLHPHDGVYYTCVAALRRGAVLAEILEKSEPFYLTSARDQAMQRMEVAKRREQRFNTFRAALRASATSRLTTGLGSSRGEPVVSAGSGVGVAPASSGFVHSGLTAGVHSHDNLSASPPDTSDPPGSAPRTDRRNRSPVPSTRAGGPQLQPPIADKHGEGESRPHTPPGTSSGGPAAARPVPSRLGQGPATQWERHSEPASPATGASPPSPSAEAEAPLDGPRPPQPAPVTMLSLASATLSSLRSLRGLKLSATGGDTAPQQQQQPQQQRQQSGGSDARSGSGEGAGAAAGTEQPSSPAATPSSSTPPSVAAPSAGGGAEETPRQPRPNSATGGASTQRPQRGAFEEPPAAAASAPPPAVPANAVSGVHSVPLPPLPPTPPPQPQEPRPPRPPSSAQEAATPPQPASRPQPPRLEPSPVRHDPATQADWSREESEELPQAAWAALASVAPRAIEWLRTEQSRRGSADDSSSLRARLHDSRTEGELMAALAALPPCRVAARLRAGPGAGMGGGSAAVGGWGRPETSVLQQGVASGPDGGLACCAARMVIIYVEFALLSESGRMMRVPDGVASPAEGFFHTAVMLTDALLSYHGLPSMPYPELEVLTRAMRALDVEYEDRTATKERPGAGPVLADCCSSLHFLVRLVRMCADVFGRRRGWLDDIPGEMIADLVDISSVRDSEADWGPQHGGGAGARQVHEQPAQEVAEGAAYNWFPLFVADMVAWHAEAVFDAAVVVSHSLNKGCRGGDTDGTINGRVTKGSKGNSSGGGGGGRASSGAKPLADLQTAYVNRVRVCCTTTASDQRLSNPWGDLFLRVETRRYKANESDRQRPPGAFTTRGEVRRTRDLAEAFRALEGCVEWGPASSCNARVGAARKGGRSCHPDGGGGEPESLPPCLLLSPHSIHALGAVSALGAEAAQAGLVTMGAGPGAGSTGGTAAGRGLAFRLSGSRAHAGWEQLRTDLAKAVLATVLDGAPQRLVAPHAGALHTLVAFCSLVSQLSLMAQPHPEVAPAGEVPSNGPLLLRFGPIPAALSSSGVELRHPQQRERPAATAVAIVSGRQRGTAPAIRANGSVGTERVAGAVAGDKTPQGAVRVHCNGGGCNAAGVALGTPGCFEAPRGGVLVTLAAGSAATADRVRGLRQYAREARQRLRARCSAEAAEAAACSCEDPSDFVIQVPDSMRVSLAENGPLGGTGGDGSGGGSSSSGGGACSAYGFGAAWWAALGLGDRFGAFRELLLNCLRTYGCAVLSCKDRDALQAAALLLAEVSEDRIRCPTGLDVLPFLAEGSRQPDIREACGRIITDLSSWKCGHPEANPQDAGPPPRGDGGRGRRNVLSVGWTAARRVSLNREACQLLGLTGWGPLGLRRRPRASHPARAATTAAAAASSDAPGRLGSTGEGEAGGPTGTGQGQPDPPDVFRFSEAVLLWVMCRGSNA